MALNINDVPLHLLLKYFDESNDLDATISLKDNVYGQGGEPLYEDSNGLTKVVPSDNSNFYRHQTAMRKMTNFSDLPAWIYHKSINPRDIVLTKTKNKSEFVYYDQYSSKVSYQWSNDSDVNVSNAYLNSSIENVLQNNPADMIYIPKNLIKTHFKPHHTNVFLEDFPEVDAYIERSADDSIMTIGNSIYINNIDDASLNTSPKLYRVNAVERKTALLGDSDESNYKKITSAGSLEAYISLGAVNEESSDIIESLAFAESAADLTNEDIIELALAKMPSLLSESEIQSLLEDAFQDVKDEEVEVSEILPLLGQPVESIELELAYRVMDPDDASYDEINENTGNPIPIEDPTFEDPNNPNLKAYIRYVTISSTINTPPSTYKELQEQFPDLVEPIENPENAGINMAMSRYNITMQAEPENEDEKGLEVYIDPDKIWFKPERLTSKFLLKLCNNLNAKQTRKYHRKLEDTDRRWKFRDKALLKTDTFNIENVTPDKINSSDTNRTVFVFKKSNEDKLLDPENENKITFLSMYYYEFEKRAGFSLPFSFLNGIINSTRNQARTFNLRRSLSNPNAVYTAIANSIQNDLFGNSEKKAEMSFVKASVYGIKTVKPYIYMLYASDSTSTMNTIAESSGNAITISFKDDTGTKDYVCDLIQEGSSERYDILHNSLIIGQISPANDIAIPNVELVELELTPENRERCEADPERWFIDETNNKIYGYSDKVAISDTRFFAVKIYLQSIKTFNHRKYICELKKDLSSQSQIESDLVINQNCFDIIPTKNFSNLEIPENHSERFNTDTSKLIFKISTIEGDDDNPITIRDSVASLYDPSSQEKANISLYLITKGFNYEFDAPNTIGGIVGDETLNSEIVTYYRPATESEKGKYIKETISYTIKNPDSDKLYVEYSELNISDILAKYPYSYYNGNLRGDYIEDNILLEKRKKSLKETLLRMLSKDDTAELNLNEEMNQYEGYINIYNYCKGIGEFMKRDSGNIQAPSTKEYPLIDINDVVKNFRIEKKSYSVIPEEHNSDITVDYTPNILESDRNIVDGRDLITRIKEYKDYPLDIIYEKLNRNTISIPDANLLETEVNANIYNRYSDNIKLASHEQVNFNDITEIADKYITTFLEYLDEDGGDIYKRELLKVTDIDSNLHDRMYQEKLLNSELKEYNELTDINEDISPEINIYDLEMSDISELIEKLIIPNGNTIWGGVYAN